MDLAMGSDEQDKLLDEKWEFLLNVDDTVSMDMIAYEYAVRAGIDPKTAANVFDVNEKLSLEK